MELGRRCVGIGAPSGSATINLRMPGQYYDVESGLFSNWNRYYNPAIGRYISSDPIGLDGGLNTFNYANVSPVMYSDPEGLEWKRPTLPTPWNIFFDLMKSTTIGTSTCRQNGVNVCSTASTAPSMSVAKPQTPDVCIVEDITEMDLPPPGKCTPEEHRDLQNKVENACGSAKSCSGNDDIATLNRKIGFHSACIAARKNLNNRCFGGGNAGHRLAADQRNSSIRNCQNFMSNMGK